MSQAKKGKNIKNILIIVAILVGAIGLVSYMSLGSRFQLAESEHPIGYYSVEIRNRDFLPSSNLDFDLLIVNDTIITTYSVVDGVVVSGSDNSTETRYSYSQSYAVIVGEGFKSQTVSIECSENEEEAIINVIDAVPMAMNSDLTSIIRISKINDEYPFISYADWSPTAGYEVEANTLYSVSIAINYSFLAFNSFGNYIGTKPLTIGDFNILPDCILESYSQYEITNELGVTNYESHFFMVNSSIQNVSSGFPGLMDPTQFTYESNNYTSIKLDPIVCSYVIDNIAKAYFNFEFQFNITSACTLKYCLFDGALDAAFNDLYSYYKIGGF